ncbi:hypothetical protein ACFQ0O_04015 [Saccharopolyspora spinosporotrichia]
MRSEVGVGPRVAVVGADLDALDGALPDQARPVRPTAPCRTTRVRDMKSGKPGGTSSALGSIRVTGSPCSPGSRRKR